MVPARARAAKPDSTRLRPRGSVLHSIARTRAAVLLTFDMRPTGQSSERAVPVARTSWRTLWLPLGAPGPVWLATALLAVVYLATMSRDLSLYDSAELALAAVQGGLSHPPGHPLYMMLGWLCARVPGVPPLLGLNALSAVPAALALVPVASLAESMAGPAPDGQRARVERYALPAVLIMLALHPALWEVASRIEVYALAAFFALWAVARTAALLAGAATSTPGVAASAPGAATSTPGVAQWLAPGLALGLSASVNPVIALVAGVSLAPALVAALVRGRLRWTQGLALVAGGLAGCLPYLYVPLVAGRRDAFVWGMPTGGEALRRFVTFADFAFKQTSSPVIIGEHALAWVQWAAAHGIVPLLVLGLVAHLRWGRQNGPGRALAPLSLGLTLLFIWRNGVYHPDIPDYLGYLMAPLSLLGAGVAALLVHLSRIRDRGARPLVLCGLLALALLLSMWLTPPPLHARARHRDDVARVLARGMLESAPPGAVLIVSTDHWVFPMMYLQEVEGLRPDVIVLLRGLSGSSWFWYHLFDLHADLREFELRGPGGQPARINRFLAANPGRPVLYEDWGHARSLDHRPACMGPWLLGDGRACAETAPARDELSPVLEQALERLGNGAPMTIELIARVAQLRGEALWRLGQAGEALRALRAGVPQDQRPPMPEGQLSGAPPLQGLLPAWREPVALGDPARNLYLAAVLLAQAGRQDDAAAHLAAAAEAGLAEALSP
jgi:hypothetical protein